MGRKTVTGSGSWRRRGIKEGLGHKGHFTCALQAGKVTWLDLASHVGQIGKKFVK